MKLTDLTIGDWVRFPNDDILDKVICIDGLRNEIDGELCSHNYCNVADLQPITLTAEILGKNGFVKGEDDATFITRTEECYIKLWKMSLCVEFEYQSYFTTDEMRININYVHELQHALRLCGLNDLANNFKI